MIITCRVCQQPFESPKRSRKYCSRSCFLKKPSTKMSIVCKQCGKSFLSYRCIVSTYCSAKCSHQDLSVRRELTLDHLHRGLWACKGCGKVLLRPKWEHTKVYCSRPCADAHRTFSDEAREKIRQTHLGHKVSSETKERIRQALIGKNVGRVHTLKHRQKNSEGVKHYYQTHPGITAGPKASRWLGGISKLPYPWDFNKSLREQIRKRDGYQCQLCLATDRLLHAHHIDYVKDNCDHSNLITLCNHCNTKVNSNRPYWTSHFQNWMKVHHPEYFLSQLSIAI